MRNNAEEIMRSSPVVYVRNSRLRGQLFDPQDTSGAIASVSANFFIDHSDVLKALRWIRAMHDWPLGDLLEGDEFLLIIEARLRARLRARGVTLDDSSCSQEITDDREPAGGSGSTL